MLKDFILTLFQIAEEIADYGSLSLRKFFP